MDAYPASAHNAHHNPSKFLQTGKAIAFSEAVRALNQKKKHSQECPFSIPPAVFEEMAKTVEQTNFSLKIGVEGTSEDSLNIRALVTSVDKGFTVMTFPAQHGSFLWELNLPAGRYRLEIKGNNAIEGSTTADIDGKVRCDSNHHSTEEEAYVMHMNFTVVG